MTERRQDGHQRSKTLQEAGEDLDRALSDLRAALEEPFRPWVIATLRWMAQRLQRLGRWMRAR